MKCPKCGWEIAEGSLYCEKCGEDIHIVPDFEPELEQNIEETICTILAELEEDQVQGDTQNQESTQNQGSTQSWERIQNQGNTQNWGGMQSREEIQNQASMQNQGGTQNRKRAKNQEVTSDKKPISGKKSRKTGRKKGHILSAILMAGLIILLAGSMAGLIYSYYSEEIQVKRAIWFTASGKYDNAISCYNRAIELNGSNVELLFSLAEVYYLKNNKIEYEYLLREIIKNPYATVEQLEGAYDKLIVIYRSRGDYQTINTLLLGSGNENLISTYQSYIASEPEFSVKEGYYTSIQPLKLTAAGTGKIYYTMDGSIPTEDGVQYTAPIILEKGDYLITAYFVNDRGVASSVVSKEYHIENDEIPPPEVSTLSGDYSFPINIEITGDDENIYYTTDGTTPTYFSNVYTGPIPMPLGKSNFKFARIVEGVTGRVADRTYQLVVNTDFTPAQAVDSVVEYAISIGKIYDEDGHFDDSGASYCYEFQYVTNINNIDDFYVIAEIFRGTDGSLTRTGNNYAVNAYHGEIFRLRQDKRGELMLIIIDKPEPPPVEEEDEDEDED